MPPQLQDLVLPPRGHPRAIRGPVHSEDLISMAREVHLELASPEVPDLQCGDERGPQEKDFSERVALSYWGGGGICCNESKA